MALCPIPCIQCVPMTLIVGVKQVKCEAVHSAVSSVEVKNFGALFLTACSPHSTLGRFIFYIFFHYCGCVLSLPRSGLYNMNCIYNLQSYIATTGDMK